MQLDKRILEGKKPLGVFELEMQESQGADACSDCRSEGSD